MYIEPNTNIKIYSGIPLDNTYENTIYWANLSEQIGYFHGGIAKYTLARNTYQRVGKGVMNVGILADNLYDCNYLAFQNENFGNKWFYAFITGVDYVNNNTTQITYEIDDMQTWYFDYELLRCFVEREHASNDAIGANLVEEGLEIGDYVQNYEDKLGISNYSVVVMTSSYFTGSYPNEEWFEVSAQYVSGTIQGVHYEVFTNDGNGVRDLINYLFVFSQRGRPDNILGVFLFPTIFNNIGQDPSALSKSIAKRYGTFDGYTPRNNKLYTYPYNFLYVTNMIGNSAIFPYEYFGGNTCTFLAYGTWTANSEVGLYPTNYKGSGNDINKDELITIKGFPQCAFNVDTFRAWLAQNTGSIGASILSASVAGTLAGGVGLVGASGASKATTALVPSGVTSLTGNVEPTTAQKLVGGSALMGTIQMLGKIYDHHVQPTQTRGNDTSTLLSCTRELDFQFINKRIRGEFARIIDDYFTMYGYATHRVKIPNIHARQRWTYTKTVGCNIKGQCPVTAISNIKRIYDKGITFWVNPSEVGNYSLSNNTL